jgi:hypothetical protein
VYSSRQSIIIPPAIQYYYHELSKALLLAAATTATAFFLFFHFTTSLCVWGTTRILKGRYGDRHTEARQAVAAADASLVAVNPSDYVPMHYL